MCLACLGAGLVQLQLQTTFAGRWSNPCKVWRQDSEVIRASRKQHSGRQRVKLAGLYSDCPKSRCRNAVAKHHRTGNTQTSKQKTQTQVRYRGRRCGRRLPMSCVVRTPCGRCAQVIIEGRETLHDDEVRHQNTTKNQLPKQTTKPKSTTKQTTTRPTQNPIKTGNVSSVRE